jgi:hypothetical protein
MRFVRYLTGESRAPSADANGSEVKTSSFEPRNVLFEISDLRIIVPPDASKFDEFIVEFGEFFLVNGYHRRDCIRSGLGWRATCGAHDNTYSRSMMDTPLPFGIVI